MSRGSDNWSGEDYRNGKCIHREDQIMVQVKNKQLLNYGKTFTDTIK